MLLPESKTPEVVSLLFPPRRRELMASTSKAGTEGNGTEAVTVIWKVDNLG
jgi:hypothetical protein